MRYLFTAIILLALCTPANAVIFIGGGAAAADDGLNDFSGDSNAIAVWNFESGALGTDSKGGNTIVDAGNWVWPPFEDSTNFKQGSVSADLEAGSSHAGIITDGNLDAGFPLKNGDNGVISVTSWFRLESTASSSSGRNLWSKYNSGDSRRSLMLTVFNTSGTSVLRISQGYNGGASFDFKEHGTTIATATWYHVTITYDATSSDAYSIRLRGSGCTVVGSDATGTFANALNVEDADWVLGDFNTSPTYIWDGNLDEMVVFNDILTEAESTKICNGTYP